MSLATVRVLPDNVGALRGAGDTLRYAGDEEARSMPALHFAAYVSNEANRRALLRALVERRPDAPDVDPDFTNRGFVNTALWVVLRQGDGVSARLLLEAGADFMRVLPFALSARHLDRRFFDLARALARDLAARAREDLASPALGNSPVWKVRS